jgi:hypothetical protein
MPRPTLEQRGSIQLDAAEIQDLATEETGTDGMAMSVSNEQDSTYLGPSSNIELARCLIRALSVQTVGKPKTLEAKSQSAFDSGMHGYSRAPSPSSPDEPMSMKLKVGAFELPPVTEMEKYIDSFFRHTGVLFPFIHEPSFRDTYRKFKSSGFKQIRRSWLGLLNIILAMGSTWAWEATEDAPTRMERSNTFYERSVVLTIKPSVRGPNIESVQYLLLASQYLQGTQKSSQTWTLHGLAVKGAFALGLHSNQPSQHFTQLEVEVRRRTWMGCILLDRVLSMTFGRPLGKCSLDPGLFLH